MALAGLGSLFVAALAFGERDWRQRIALATCCSVGLSLIGVMTLTLTGLTGGVLRVLSHGLTVGLLVWLLPTRSGEWRVASGEPDNAAPLPSNSPLAPHPSPHVSSRWRVGLVRFALFAWIGLPGSSGFVAEFLTPFGLFQHEFNVAALSLMISGLIAWMWVRAERELPSWSWDSWTRRDAFIAAMLVGLNVALGLAPQFVVNRLQPSLLPLLPMEQAASVSEGR
jgi:NADH:ubiquinone oxidoreductase subunit 4 (subunit M)